jgi:galactokinase
MVALLEEGQVSQYLDILKKKYYKEVHGIEDIDPHVFITQPGAGATIFTK